MHTAIKRFKGLIEPHFDYCNVVWDGFSRQLSEKLQKLQNRAARVITTSSYDTNSRYLLNSLSRDNLSVRRAKQKANLMYTCINKLAPYYVCNMFTPRTLPFDLRDARRKLYLPKPRTDYLKRSFSMEWSSRGTSHYKISIQLIEKHWYSLHRTPTRQTCKPVNRTFYMWCISFFYYCYSDIFTVFLNKVFIRSFSESLVFSWSQMFLTASGITKSPPSGPFWK